MKTRNGFLFPLNLLKQILIAGVLLVGVQSLNAKPLEPLNVFDYLARLNDLRYTALDHSTVKTLATEVFQGCVIDDVQYTVMDPLTNTSHEVKVAIYHPLNTGKYPATIIVPTILGRSVIENSIAYRFCITNMVGIIADVNSTLAPQTLPDWDLSDRNNRKALIDLRTLIDLLETHSQIDPQRIAGYGLSLGAYSVSLLATVDQRLKAVALVAGAGNMPAILANSVQKFPVQLREMRMKSTGDHSVAHYEDNLRATIKYDPIYMAKNQNTSKFFMLMDLDDTYVPAENQLEFWNALGKPGHLDVHASHDQTILAAATVHFNEILNEIVSRLNK